MPDEAVIVTQGGEEAVALLERAFAPIHDLGYAPADWYWRRDLDGALFSSARIAIVSEADEAFQAWRAVGHVPTRWPVDDAGEQTVSELQTVLDPYDLHASLEHLAGSLRYAAEVGGIEVAGERIATNRESQAQIQALEHDAEREPEELVSFRFQNGYRTIDSATVLIIAAEVRAHKRRLRALDADVRAKIASGTFATKEQVEAAFAPQA